MPGFSRLQVNGYRRVRDLDLPLAPLNVLIGANGVGKSSVIEVFDLLAEAPMVRSKSRSGTQGASRAF